MKKTTITSVLSLGLLVAPLAFAATSPEKAYVESYRGRDGIPVPVSVVSPEVGRSQAGMEVELVFVVDETGTPVNIEARKGADAALVDEVIAAVAKWRFSPARNADGEPVARKVLLPVHIVDRTPGHPLFAAK